MIRRRNKTLFRLYATNIVLLTLIFVIFAVSLNIAIRYLMWPYYLGVLHEGVREDVEKREAIIAAKLLTGEADDIESLHPYTMNDYALYGLMNNCAGRLETFGWGATCEVDGRYFVEVPIRSADNTLAHFVVELKPDLDAWHPYRIVRNGIIAFVAIALIGSLLMILIFYFRFARPIKKQIDGLTADPESVDYDVLKANLPIDECLQLTAQLELYHGLAAQNQKMAAIGNMSSHIAHDMRSPLSVLKMYVGMKSKGTDKDEKELRVAAERSVGKLQRMADDLVNYAKASRIDRQEHEIGMCIRDGVITGAQQSAQEHGIRVHYDGRGQIVAKVDRHKLERVILNIVNNAIQAVEPHTGQIVVVADIEAENTLRIQVRDNGKGIAQEHLPHIFDDFFTMGKKGGSGLGLAYCKQVVEAHGGTLDVESELGRGTTFTITIPNCVVY